MTELQTIQDNGKDESALMLAMVYANEQSPPDDEEMEDMG